ncbi:MAG: hypothetical protein EPN20_05520 [Magnetospirillum sp.]|nr:MAG: hypothetical protein EPN20_05520 [Magnetospirillum sp.]
MTMAKRIPLTAVQKAEMALATAQAAYDPAEAEWQAAMEWSRFLGKAFDLLLDRHTDIGRRLNMAFKAVSQGVAPHEDIDALWAKEKAARNELQGLMACRRASNIRQNLAYKAVRSTGDRVDRAYSALDRANRRAAA